MKTAQVIGAFAPVKYTDPEGGEEFVLFIIGDNHVEIDEHDKIILERFGDAEDFYDITVIEVTSKEWWDIKHGTNISKGFYIHDTDEIETIRKR